MTARRSSRSSSGSPAASAKWKTRLSGFLRVVEAEHLGQQRRPKPVIVARTARLCPCRRVRRIDGERGRRPACVAGVRARLRDLVVATPARGEAGQVALDVGDHDRDAGRDSCSVRPCSVFVLPVAAWRRRSSPCRCHRLPHPHRARHGCAVTVGTRRPTLQRGTGHTRTAARAARQLLNSEAPQPDPVRFDSVPFPGRPALSSAAAPFFPITSWSCGTAAAHERSTTI